MVQAQFQTPEPKLTYQVDRTPFASSIIWHLFFPASLLLSTSRQSDSY
jgi:hypothetical protein